MARSAKERMLNEVKEGARQVCQYRNRAPKFPCLLMVPFTVMAATLSGQSPPFVPGQVVAKFVPGSEAGTLVARAAERQPLDLSGLVPVTNRLGDVVGIPLKASGLGSGNFCVLSVDIGQLKDRLARRLRAREGVERVEIAPDTAAVLVTVTFLSGSEESRMRPARLIESLQRELAVPLKGEGVEQGRVVLRVDLESLTPRLVERLKALPEILTAQPNYVLKGFR